ncbi:MAG: YcxB family protein, partial [Lachnospiraceae bacterium]|nr:YcxB family protein [Lachnospiraceae bacterium]
TSQEIFKTPIIYNLCKDGLVVRQGELKVNVSWDDISKIVETRKAFFLYTSPVRAFIFPKRLLDDTKEFSDIVRKALKGA